MTARWTQAAVSAISVVSPKIASRIDCHHVDTNALVRIKLKSLTIFSLLTSRQQGVRGLMFPTGQRSRKRTRSRVQKPKKLLENLTLPTSLGSELQTLTVPVV